MKWFEVYMDQAGGDGGAGGGGGTPPAATPPAATPPAAAPAAAPAPVSFRASGNPVVDYAMAELAVMGIADSHPAMTLASTGDFTMLEIELAKQGKPTGPALVNALKAQHAAAQAAQAAALKQSDEALLATFGSEETKKAALNWVSQTADPDEAKAINAMLAMGGAHAKVASIAMAALYSQHGGGAPAAPAAAPKAMTKEEVAAGAAAGGTPLTRRAFAEESQKLSREMGGGDVTRHPGYAALVARRKAGQSLGI